MTSRFQASFIQINLHRSQFEIERVRKRMRSEIETKKEGKKDDESE